MNQKPLISINKFSGSGEYGILFNEGFYPEVDNGKSVMGEGFTTNNIVNTLTSGFSNIGDIMSILSLATISSYADIYQLYYNSTGKFFSYSLSSSITDKEIHNNGQTSSLFPDLIETSLGNILYTSQNKIGRAVRGKVSSGSTTTLVDITKNFTTLGYAANDKVTNLKTGIEYTITSISTTTNTNDTLNFSANGANTQTVGDEYLVWEDDRLDVTSTRQSWQPDLPNWSKQIKQYGSQYLITNGNYIGSVSADESTVDATYKQLPAKHQSLCFDINVSSVLVSAEFNGKGVLLLWDGYSDGWNNILEIDSPVKSLIKYKSGWVYVLNGTVYYTDGYQIEKMIDLNVSKLLSSLSLNPTSFNGLVLYRGMLYCASYNNNDLNLLRDGVYTVDLLNIKNGWSLIKCKKSTRLNGQPISVFLINRFSLSPQIQIGGSGFVSAIAGGTSSDYCDKSLILYLDLPQVHRITGVGLNIGRYLKDYNDDTVAMTRDIQVSIGDGKRGLISRAYTVSLGAPSSSFIIDGTVLVNNEVGDELRISDIGEATYDERTFITAIANKGSNTETWSISPALSTTHTDGTTLEMLRVKKLDRKTLHYNKLEEEIMFNGSGVLSNKIFLEIVLFGKGTTFPINISEINIYGD